MSWVWEFGPANGTERMLLLALADHCDDAGRAFPSMAGLADKACVTERGARQIMRRLEADGWVKTRIGGGRGGKNQYQILMVNPERETGNEKPGMRNPEPDDTKPGTTLPETRNPGSAEPSVTIIEPSKVVYAGARDHLVPLVGDELTDAFIEVRKAQRAPLTERAAKIIARKLSAMPNPAASMEQSITRGWRDVFPVKADVHPFPSKRQSDAERLDDHLADLQARLAVQRLE